MLPTTADVTKLIKLNFNKLLTLEIIWVEALEYENQNNILFPYVTFFNEYVSRQKTVKCKTPMQTDTGKT